MYDFLKVFVIGGLWWPKATYQVSYLILKRYLTFECLVFREETWGPEEKKASYLI